MVVRVWPMAFLAFTACESGTAVRVSVDVGADAAASFSASAPGVLVVHPSSGWRVAAGTVCGADASGALEYVQDYGFGCLDDDVEGTEEVVTAWIEPMPAAWNAASFCALARSSEWSDLAIGPAVTGDDEVAAVDQLAEAPSADWPQGSGSGTWGRDVSPCGGIATVALRVE